MRPVELCSSVRSLPTYLAVTRILGSSSPRIDITGVARGSRCLPFARLRGPYCAITAGDSAAIASSRLISQDAILERNRLQPVANGLQRVAIASDRADFAQLREGTRRKRQRPGLCGNRRSPGRHPGLPADRNSLLYCQCRHRWPGYGIRRNPLLVEAIARRWKVDPITAVHSYTGLP